MKKLISLVLAAVMISASLSACASVRNTPAIGANITLTSSDAIDAAAWLTERFGAIPDKLVIGTDSGAYGADVSALEDDGYIIRNIGGEIALFAKTADGLERAVRRYAKTVEAGEAVADETYHEGYRIEELRLAGVDVGEYAVAVEGEDEYIRLWAEENAAKPFSDLLNIACGAELLIGGEAEHRIIFRQIADESFKESSYHYYFDGGDLIFEYADLGGARNAAVKFIEAQCGWDDLYYGVDLLKEADLIDVPAATDVLCHPRFDGIRHTTLSQFYGQNTLYSVSYTAFTYKYRVETAHHFLGVPGRWGGDYGIWGNHHPGTMICLTDDEALDTVIEEIAANIEGKLASGSVIGDDFRTINLGMEDGNFWCSCRNCEKLRIAEGNTWAGPMVRFANAVEEAIDDAGYDGLKYPIFAYLGSNQPPKTAPNPDVYVTFVCDSQCNKHDMTGDQCYSVLGTAEGVLAHKNNDVYARWIKEWLDLTPNLAVRPAPLSPHYTTFTLIAQTYDDVKFLSDIGVRWIYDEIYSTEESDPMLIISELWDSLMFDPDMTRAEYYEEAARLLEKYYGDGWRHVDRYFDLLEEAEIAGKYCWTNWFSPSYYMVDLDLYAASWDEMLSELVLAERDANSAHQVDLIRRLRTAALFSGCTLLYFKEYELGDYAALELLRTRWAQMYEVLATCGIEKLVSDRRILVSLDDTMWKTGYLDGRSLLVYRIMGRGTMRPAPEEYGSNGN